MFIMCQQLPVDIRKYIFIIIERAHKPTSPQASKAGANDDNFFGHCSRFEVL